jgi:hypothetical protein
MISLLNVLLIFILVESLQCESKPVSIGLGKKHVMPNYKNYQRRAKEAGVPSLPVWGNVWPVAIYWTYIRVGTPLQKYPVALDTGSMTLDIVGPNCKVVFFGCVSYCLVGLVCVFISLCVC